MARSRRLTFGLMGVALSTGAPVGLFLVRILEGKARLGSLGQEWSGNQVTYLYLTLSTALVFGGFGAVLGHGADRLARLATSDPLTGLLNRMGMAQRLADETHRWQRYPGPLSVLLIDVDRMKQVNDQHGHRAGDEALRSVARALVDGCRVTDSASRWGGDEFLVLAPATSLAEAQVLASRIRQTACAPDLPFLFSVSIGVASRPRWTCETSMEELVQAADDALYQAKRTGRGRVALPLEEER